MANERRFLAGFREADTDEPGLIQENDGTVWLINPDGTREQVAGGGGSFNGGTITEPLVIEATYPFDNAGLHVQTDGTQAGSPLLLDAALEGDPTGQFEFQPEGRILITSFTAGGDEARIELADTTPGNPGLINISTYSGIQLAIEASGQSFISISPLAGHTGFLLDVRDVNGAPCFQIHSDGSVHIPTGTSILADL